MKQRIGPATIDTVTPDEIVHLIPRPPVREIVRASETQLLNANGNGTVVVYKVPAGYELQVRRVFMDIGGATDPNTGNVALGAGKYCRYLRSDDPIEYGQPQYGATLQVPGSQTWGDQQGPYLRNEETFAVQVVGFTASAILTVRIQAILTKRSEGEK